MSKIKSCAALQAGAALALYECNPGLPTRDNIEVKTEYCGICHSDLSMVDNKWGLSSYPLIAGHEVVGHIHALGEAAKNKGLKTGPRVGGRMDGAKLPAL